MTLAVRQYLREEHQLMVGERTAEEAKIRAATEHEPSFLVSGRDAASGRPRLLMLAVDEIETAVRPVVDTIVQTLAACLDELPPEGVADVMTDGVLAVGGGSLLRGFTKRLEGAFGFAVTVAEEPLTCVALGAAACLHRDDVVHAFAVS
jgi:rod shape-determining protein MreB